jgi:hypothetical protein
MTRSTIRSLKWAALALALIIPAGVAKQVRAQNPSPPGAATRLGQLSGLLPRDHLTLESAIQVDLSNETVRLPLHPGKVHGKPVWYILLDASDAGAARDLGVNYAPKLANIAIGCPACVQTVTVEKPTPAQNRFGPAVVDFQGAPDFSPTRISATHARAWPGGQDTQGSGDQAVLQGQGNRFGPTRDAELGEDAADVCFGGRGADH